MGNSERKLGVKLSPLLERGDERLPSSTYTGEEILSLGSSLSGTQRPRGGFSRKILGFSAAGRVCQRARPTAIWKVFTIWD